MGKKELTYEQATENLEAAVAARKAARAELDKLAADNGLNPKKIKDHFEHKELGKQFKKLHKTWSEAKEAETAAQEAAKSLKPKTERSSKYEYPEDVVSESDKKKYRAKMRAAANKPEKEEKSSKEGKKAKEEKAEKSEKSEKSEKTPKEEKGSKEKSSKEGKKAKKKKEKSAEDED